MKDLKEIINENKKQPKGKIQSSFEVALRTYILNDAIHYIDDDSKAKSEDEFYNGLKAACKNSIDYFSHQAFIDKESGKFVYQKAIDVLTNFNEFLEKNTK